jgi:hypothetical protein
MSVNDNISQRKVTLTFDFNKAVADARRDYPEETKNITFIDGSDSDPIKQFVAWINSTSPEFQQLILRDRGLKSTAETWARESFTTRRGMLTLRDPVSEKAAVIVDHKGSLVRYYLSPSVPLKRVANFFFNHEFGHALLEKGLVTSMNQFSTINEFVTFGFEINADAFAVLRSFQQGSLDMEDMKKFISRRNLEGPTHRTAYFLNKLASEIKPENMPTRTPQEVKNLAAEKAQKYVSCIGG